jgi:hypothetical protein
VPSTEYRNSRSQTGRKRTIFGTPRQDDEIGPPDGGTGFSKESRRQGQSVAEWVPAIEKQDVQVPPEPEVLESVVKDEAVGVEFPLRKSPRLVPVVTDEYQEPRQLLCQEVRFVTSHLS